MNQESVPPSIRAMSRNALEDELVRIRRELALAYDNLTAVQERCTELKEEMRDYMRQTSLHR